MTVKPSVRKTKVILTVKPRAKTAPTTGVYVKKTGKKKA